MDLLKSILFSFLLSGSILTHAVDPADTSTIDINRASASELSTLKQIGPKKAQAIVDYRTEHGHFANVSDLTNVKGIGNNAIEINKDRLIVSQ